MYLTLLLVTVMVVYVSRPFAPVVPRSMRESFLDPSAAAESTDVQLLQNIRIPSALRARRPPKVRAILADSGTGALRLRDAFVKASFNSAWDGSKCSAPMLTYVISRGCRFLDAEVFLAAGPDEGAVGDTKFLMVGFGGNRRQNKGGWVLGKETLTFADFLRVALSDAFSPSVSAVSSDPLFLHFRLQIAEGDAARAVTSMRLLLQEFVREDRVLSEAELAGKFTLGNMRAKVALLFDQLTCPWLVARKADLGAFCSGFTGTAGFPLYKAGEGKKPERDRGSGDSVVGVAIPPPARMSVLETLFGVSLGGAPETYSLWDMQPHRGSPVAQTVVFLAMPYYVPGRALEFVESFFDHVGAAVSAREQVHAFVASRSD